MSDPRRLWPALMVTGLEVAVSTAPAMAQGQA
jgi:hypothetical protein